MLTQPDLYPTGTGQRGGIVAHPTVPLAGLPLSAGQAEAQGLSALGQGLETLGAGLQRREMLQAAMQKAQDTVDTAEVSNAYTQQLDTYVAERLRDTDYRALPGLVDGYHKQLVGDLGQRLSPRAQQLFRVKAGERFNVVNRDVQRHFTIQMLANGVVQADNAQALFVDTMVHARDEDTIAQGTVQFLRTLTELGEAGVFPAAEVHKRFQAGQDKVVIVQSEMAARTQPQAFQDHLRDVQAGGQGNPAFPVPPAAAMPGLLDETTKQIAAGAQREDRQQRYYDQWRAKQQDQAYSDLRARITEVTPTLEAVPQYETLLQEVNTQARAGHLKPEQQGQLDTLVRQMQGVARAPREHDDPTAERHLSVLLGAIDTPHDLADFREQLIQRAALLKADTIRTFQSAIRDRATGDHWTNQPGVREARRIIYGADLGEMAYTGQMARILKPEEETRIREAWDAFSAWAERRASESTRGMNVEATAIARELRRAYLELPKRAEDIQGLPAILLDAEQKPVRDEALVRQRLEGLKIPEAQRKALLDQWKRTQTPLSEPSAAPPGTAGSRRQRVPEGQTRP